LHIPHTVSFLLLFLSAIFSCSLYCASLCHAKLTLTSHTHLDWPIPCSRIFEGVKRRREKDDVQYLNPTAKSYLFAIDNKSILNDTINSTWI